MQHLGISVTLSLDDDGALASLEMAQAQHLTLERCGDGGWTLRVACVDRSVYDLFVAAGTDVSVVVERDGVPVVDLNDE